MLEQQLSYWKAQLSGALPVLELPTDRPRPPVQSYRAARAHRLLPQTVTRGLIELSHREGATLFMTLLSAFQTLLHRHTGQDDIVVGTPIAGRHRAETEGLIGFLTNTLVMRTDFSGNPTFREVSRRVREVTRGAHAHADLPFEKEVDEMVAWALQRTADGAMQAEQFQVFSLVVMQVRQSIERRRERRG